MKRWLVVLAGMGLLVSTAAEAAPVYGTTMPDKKQAVWGLQHYSVFHRNLDGHQGSIESRQNFLLLSYGVTEWFSLDLKWSLYSRFRQKDESGASGMEYENPVWGGGYGFRVRLLEKGPWKVVGGFQHISIHPRTVKANGSKHSAILDDWQYSALVSYAFKRLTPYAGVRYAMMDYIHFINKDDRNRLRSDDARRLSPILGVDIPITERVWINLETDWQDGGSATAGVHVRF